MKQVNTIHHIVHLWFETTKQKQLEENIIKLIDELAKDVNGIISFVDQYKPIKEDMDIKRIKNIYNTLFFLFIYKIDNREFFEDLVKNSEISWYEKNISSVVSDYFFSEFSEKRIKDFFNSAGFDDRAVLIGDNKLWVDFEMVLMQLIEQLENHPIFQIEYFKWFEAVPLANEARRLKIEEYARDRLWDERIIQNWMRWDFTFEWVFAKFEKPEIWIKSFNKLLYDKLIYLYLIRPMSVLQKSLEKKWLNFIDCKHIVWWEYYDRCVHLYKNALKLYWVKSEIEIDKNISIIHDDDIIQI